MTENLYNALERALKALESDTKPEIRVSECSENEAVLCNLIETAQIARTQVADGEIKAVSQRSRTRVLARAAQLRQFSQSRPSTYNRNPRLAYFLVLAIVILVSFSGFTITSAQALPGDQLYPVKLAVEDLSLDLSLGVADHRVLEDRYQERRIDEVNRLLVLDRLEFVEFYGKVINIEKDKWDVGGISVHLNLQTILIGDILPGMTVEVEGTTQTGGYVLASEIHLQKFGFVGYVESIGPESWSVSGRLIRITSETQLNPEISVGDWVIVSVRADDLGHLDALVIENASLPTPTPGPTSVPQKQEDIQDLDDYDHEDDQADDLDEEQGVDANGEQNKEDDNTEYDQTDNADRSVDHPKETDENDEDESEEEQEGSETEEVDDGDGEQDEKNDD